MVAPLSVEWKQKTHDFLCSKLKTFKETLNDLDKVIKYIPYYYLDKVIKYNPYYIL